jgi:hypothetical protein
LQSPTSKDIVWTESLSEFREALLNLDKKTVKQFFEFPILNPGNGIWLVADMKSATQLASDKIVPFKRLILTNTLANFLPLTSERPLKKLI